MNDDLYIILNHIREERIPQDIISREMKKNKDFKCGCGSVFKSLKNLQSHLKRNGKKHNKWLKKVCINTYMEEIEKYREHVYTLNSMILLEHKQQTNPTKLQCKCHSVLKNERTFKNHIKSHKHKKWLFETILNNPLEKKSPYKIICDCENIVYNTNWCRHVNGRSHTRKVTRMDNHIKGYPYIIGDSCIKCHYCTLEYNSHDMISVLPCCGGHFHRRCIYNWRTLNNNKCPLCNVHIPTKNLFSSLELETLGRCIFFQNRNKFLLKKILIDYNDQVTIFLHRIFDISSLITNSFVHIEELISTLNNVNVNTQYTRIIQHYNVHIYPHINEVISFSQELSTLIQSSRLNTSYIWKNIRPHLLWLNDNSNYLEELNKYYEELWDYVTRIFTPVINESDVINQGLSSSIERKDHVTHDFKKILFSPSKIRMKKCVICLDDFIKGDTVTLTKCSHCFHFHCIEENVHYSNDCPLCRTRL